MEDERPFEDGQPTSMNSLSCDKVEVLISANFDGELDATERKRLTIHLKTCRSCAQHQTQFAGSLVHLQFEQTQTPMEDASLIELTKSILGKVEVRERRVHRTRHRGRRIKMQLIFATLPFTLCLILLGTGVLADVRIVPTHVATPCTQHIKTLHGRLAPPVRAVGQR